MAGEDEGTLEAAEAAASAAGVGAPLLEAAAARRVEIHETLQLRAEEEARYISPTPPRHLPYISPTSHLCLTYVSPTSRLHLP